MTEFDAYSDGIKCFHAGYTRGMNPCEPGSYNHIAWINGWLDAKAGRPW
jgi:hypothetical protein